ncbi:MHCK EF2 kinase domain [Chlorella sorokiniana]|uniref:MHCK EF2 kinase domain n=1 Tax=Chlorella sorokiniana TaxID=3076 RepID=A0A2P6TC90_CHLSO|nr:MHCK EF2 kinase domain [Chlorella sorokiniana]|eukprot:PRW20254.1 MHCK EF2 kinase domain [Chlorella sorokiniana]
MAAAQEWDMLQDLTEEDLLAQLEALDPEAAADARAAGSGALSAIEGAALALEAAPPSPPAGPSSSAGPSTLTEQLLNKLEQLTTENEAIKAALATGTGLADHDSRSRRPTRSTLDTASVLKASAARAQALAGSAAGATELERLVAQKKAALEFKQRGVDFCVLMDCTGSMSNCIEQAKSKAREIFDLAPSMHPDAIVRLAFVGYRDYGAEAGDGQHVVVDFVDKSRFSTLQGTLSAIRACGGGNAEDVTGALKDAPCHGNRYHNGHPVNGPDSYPTGDPTGLVPEELLKLLVTNRVDYHFARIGAHTGIMTGIFKQVYDDSPGAGLCLRSTTTPTRLAASCR